MSEENAVRALIKKVPQLPVVPAMFQTLRRLLADDSTDLRQIAATIQQDPSISAKVLQLANSVVFRRGAPIANLEAAVLRIGSAALSRLVLVEGVLSTDYPVARFHFPDEARRYFMASLVAESAVANDQRDEAALAVLLCPIGRLVMMAADPERLEHVMMVSAGDVARMLAEERTQFGTTHAAVGAYLIGGWGLPPGVARGVGLQYTRGPIDIADSTTAATLFANRDIRGVPVEAPALASFAAAWDRQKARVAFLDAA